MTERTSSPTTVFSRPMAMITLGGLFAVNAVSIDGTIVAIPGIAADFGVAPGQAQRVTTLFLLGFALAHIPIGLLGDRFGRKPVILIGLILAGILSVIACLAPTLEILIAARFFQGAATASAGLLSKAMIRDVATGREASRLTSNALSTLAVLIVVAPILSGVLLTAGGWQAVFAMISAYLMALIFLTWWIVPETMAAERHRAHPWEQFKASAAAFAASKQSILATVLGGITFSTYFIFANVGSSMLVDVYDRPAAMFGMLFALTAVVQFFAATTNSRLVGTRGTFGMLRVAAALCLTGVVLAGIGAALGGVPLAMFIVIATIFAITHGITLPNSIALALDPLGKTAGFAASIHGMCQTGLAGVTGIFVSELYDGTGPTVLLLFAGCGSLSLLMFVIGRSMLYAPAESE